MRNNRKSEFNEAGVFNAVGLCVGDWTGAGNAYSLSSATGWVAATGRSGLAPRVLLYSDNGGPAYLQVFRTADRGGWRLPTLSLKTSRSLRAL